MIAPPVEPGFSRFVITLSEDIGGMVTSGLAFESGTIVSTVSSFDGTHDLAIIDVPSADLEDFQTILDEDEYVLSYRIESSR
jgi:hypothetical protein